MRRAVTAQSFADRIYLVSGEEAICLVSSARLEIGCDVLDAERPAVTAHTIICSPYLPSGIGEVYGTVPDAASDVRVALRDGSVARPIVAANVLRYYWAKHRRSLPRTVQWEAQGRRHSVAVPLPRGRGWLDCGRVSAP